MNISGYALSMPVEKETRSCFHRCSSFQGLPEKQELVLGLFKRENVTGDMLCKCGVAERMNLMYQRLLSHIMRVTEGLPEPRAKLWVNTHVTDLDL